MTFDSSDKLIPTFPDINDNPRVPTASKAGNASHLISVHNKLVVDTEAALQELSTQIGNSQGNGTTLWKIVSDPYSSVQVGEKILVDTFNPPGDLTEVVLELPEDPPEGSQIDFYRPNGDIPVRLAYYRRFIGMWGNSLSISAIGEQISLIYIDENIGWIPTQPGKFTLDIGES